MSVPTTLQIQAALTITWDIMSKARFSRDNSGLAKKVYADVLQAVMEYGVPPFYKID